MACSHGRVHTSSLFLSLYRCDRFSPPPFLPPHPLSVLDGALGHLKHLTSALRLDYCKFMSDYDQTVYYAAQQEESSIFDYTPQTLLVCDFSYRIKLPS